MKEADKWRKQTDIKRKVYREDIEKKYGHFNNI